MSILAKYNLNGTPNDYTGNGFNLTNTNGIFIAGVNGNSISFSGSNSHAYILNNLGYTANGQFSINFIFFNPTAGQANRYLFNIATSTGGNRFLALYTDGSGIINYYASGTNYSTGSQFLNKWNVVTILENNGTSSLYINSVFITTITHSTGGGNDNGLGLSCPINNLTLAQGQYKFDEVYIQNSNISVGTIKNNYAYYKGFI